MMDKLKKIIFIIAPFIFTSILISAPLLNSVNFFTPNESRAAAAGEFLTSVILKGKGAVSSGGVEKNYPVQNSYLKVSSSDYDMIAVEKGFFRMEQNSWSRQKIYKSLTDFSLLKGMQYYSQTQKGSSTLIIDSYRVSSGNDYSIENINDKNIPASSLSHFSIKDNRLGVLSFKSEFFSSGDNFVSINTLTGRASKYGMDIFYPGDYRIYKLLIYDKKLKGYFFYTAQFMKVRSGILNRLDLVKPESFANRVRAENIHFLKSIGVDRSSKLAAFY
jgi:hypothetical protein